MDTEPRANKACDDLIAFLALAKDMPDAAQAFGDCIKFVVPVIDAHIDQEATAIAGKFVFRFELNKTLMGYLTAFRASQRVDTGTPSVI